MGAAPSFVPTHNRNGDVDFDNVMNRIQASIRGAPKMEPAPQTLNAMHLARATTPPVETNAMAAHGNNTAMRAMSSFIDANMRSIRRLSKIPPMALSFEQLQKQFEGDRVGRLPTPPSSSHTIARHIPGKDDGRPEWAPPEQPNHHHDTRLRQIPKPGHGHGLDHGNEQSLAPDTAPRADDGDGCHDEQVERAVTGEVGAGLTCEVAQ